jgi:hypothetical protein
MNQRPPGWIKSIVYRTLLAAGAVAIVSVAIVKALASFHYGLTYPMVVLLLVLVAVPLLVVRRIDEQDAPRTLFDDPATPRSFPDADDAVQAAVAHWHRRLDFRPDEAQAARVLRAQLTDLVADRLRLVHRIDVARDPERVRRLVGPTVWSLLTRPAVPIPPDEVARLIIEMDAL